MIVTFLPANISSGAYPCHIMIETPRLILREWKETDTSHFLNLNACPVTMKYFPNILEEAETLSMLVRIKQHFIDWGYGLYATEVRSSGEFIGFVGLSHPRFENHLTPCVEIGWRLYHKSWNQGYATEAARAVVDYAFEILQLEELLSWTAIVNKPSERIMQKIGMTYIETFMHPNLDQDDPLAEHVAYRLSNK